MRGVNGKRLMCSRIGCVIALSTFDVLTMGDPRIIHIILYAVG